MRKLTILLALPLMFACSKGEKEVAILAGKFTNAPEKIILNSAGKVDTILLNQDGSFVYKVQLDKPRFYTLKAARTLTKLYLVPGDSAYLEFNINSPEGPTFTADNKELHANIYERSVKMRDFVGNWRQLFILDIDSFNNKIDSIQQVLNAMIDSANEISNDLKELEKNRVNYSTLSLRINYPEYSAYVTGKKFNPDSTDYSMLDKVDMNNGYHLMFDNYAAIISTYIRTNLDKIDQYKEAAKKSVAERLPLEFKYIDSLISNQTIRDYIKMNTLKDEITYGDFYTLTDVVKLFNESCQTPCYKKLVNAAFDKKMQLAPGKNAPDFKYADINGKEYALSDFKGKLVYIDFWATWCGPCRHELPYLEKLQEKFHNKNIVFMSVSLDDNVKAWDKMVKEKKMKGIQLHADGAWASDAAKRFQIHSIPTFYLIGADGTIIRPNAPRPSSEEIENLINEELAKL